MLYISLLMKKTKIVISFDIETAGHRLGYHSLLAIGMVATKVINYEYTFMESLEVHIHHDPIVFDSSTKEWWSKNEEAFNVLIQNTISPESASRQIVDFIKKYQQIAYEFDYNYQILTDNSWFDETWISHFICKYTEDGYPLRHLYFQDSYMNVTNCIDLNQRIQALNNDCQLKIKFYVPHEEHVSHDHTPVNDAKGLMQKYVYYLRETKIRRDAQKPQKKGT
jgi:hypothetical protein